MPEHAEGAAESRKRKADAVADAKEGEPASNRRVRFVEPEAGAPEAHSSDDDQSGSENEGEQGHSPQPVRSTAAEKGAEQLTDWHTSVMNLLTPEQQNRFEAFRRSSLARRNMKRLQQTVASQMVNMNMVIVMCGISKVFVGELVEKARCIAADRGDSGPLRRAHIEASYQALDRAGRIPHRRCSKRLLK